MTNAFLPVSFLLRPTGNERLLFLPHRRSYPIFYTTVLILKAIFLFHLHGRLIRALLRKLSKHYISHSFAEIIYLSIIIIFFTAELKDLMKYQGSIILGL